MDCNDSSTLQLVVSPRIALIILIVHIILMCFIQFLFQIKKQQQHRIDYELPSAFSCLLSREGALSQTASCFYSLSQWWNIKWNEAHSKIKQVGTTQLFSCSVPHNMLAWPPWLDSMKGHTVCEAVCSSSLEPHGLVTSLGRGRFSGHDPVLPVRQSTTCAEAVFFFFFLLEDFENTWEAKLVSVNGQGEGLRWI